VALIDLNRDSLRRHGSAPVIASIQDNEGRLYTLGSPFIKHLQVGAIGPGAYPSAMTCDQHLRIH
jgi:hypothetical protein